MSLLDQRMKTIKIMISSLLLSPHFVNFSKLYYFFLLFSTLDRCLTLPTDRRKKKPENNTDVVNHDCIKKKKDDLKSQNIYTLKNKKFVVLIF